MRAIIQRVTKASVSINGEIFNSIEQGLLILLGIEEADETSDMSWLIKKIAMMRIFNDDQGVMNRSLIDIQGESLIISQFTLHASTKKGNRPSYIKAAKPEKSKPMYEEFVNQFHEFTNLPSRPGIFGADMKVQLINDGPVTIVIDSKNKE